MAPKLKTLVVFGTRPEAIKLAPLVRILRHHGQFDVTSCFTGQHRGMVTSVLGFFELEVDYDLDIMQPRQTLTGIAARTLLGVDRVLEEIRPHWVIVQGDTTTAFAAALAAFHQRTKVAHVEAGLRSFDRSRPFPEEVNRLMISVLADLHFCPTNTAKANLVAERIPPERVHVVGNSVIDALHIGLSRLASGACTELIQSQTPRLVEGRKVVLVTGHRRESFGEPLREICLALRDIAQTCPVDIVYPVHLNPNVRAPVHEILADLPNVHLIEPVDYPVLLWLAQRAHFILTDSGGIQEEAAALGKPVLVMRDVTERQESVIAGVSRLVGANRRNIVEWAVRLIEDEHMHASMARPVDVYGDGHACERMAALLLDQACA